MNIYTYDDYRSLLKDSVLELKRTHGTAFTFQKMASHCRVQKAYLSNVLKGQGDLSNDQIFLACEYLNFSEEKYHYVAVLSEWQKSVAKSRQCKLLDELQSLRRNGRKIKNRLEGIQQSQSKLHEWYYLDIHAQLIRMFLTLPRFQKDPIALLEFINITKPYLFRKLQKLLDSNLIVHESQIWKPSGEVNSHLDEETPIYAAFFKSRLLKAIEYSERSHSPHNIQFSALFTADQNAYQSINESLLASIADAKKSVGKAKEEDAFILNVQLLKLSSCK